MYPNSPVLFIKKTQKTTQFPLAEHPSLSCIFPPFLLQHLISRLPLWLQPFPWICLNSGSPGRWCWGGWGCTPALPGAPAVPWAAVTQPGDRAGRAAISREEGEEIVSRHSAFLCQNREFQLLHAFCIPCIVPYNRAGKWFSIFC